MHNLSAVSSSTTLKTLSSCYSGGVSIFKGASKVAAQIPKKPETQAFKAIKAIDILSNSTQIASGAFKVTSNGISFLAANAATTIKTDLVGVSTIFSTASSVSSALVSAINLAQPSIKIDLARRLMEELKKSDSSTVFDLQNLKSVAPNSSSKIESTESKVTLTDEIKKEIIQELNRSIIDSGVAIGALLLSLGSAVIGFSPLGSAGVLTSAIIGLFAKAVTTTTDGISTVESLKKAKEISEKDFIIKVITIVLSIVSLVLGLIFASSLAIAIPTAILSLLAVSFSIAALAHSKLIKSNDSSKDKEALLKAEQDIGKKLQEQVAIKKLAEDLHKQTVAKFMGHVDSTVKSKECFNENYLTNLKLIQASGVFGKDQAFRWNSNKAMVKYPETEALFLERVKNGKGQSLVSFNLKEGEKVDLDLIASLSKVSDLRINGTVFSKAFLNY
jgi:hypothetical protein